MGDTGVMAQKASQIRGPTGYELWKAFSADEPLQSILEFTLYSDAQVTAEIHEGLGPFSSQHYCDCQSTARR